MVTKGVSWIRMGVSMMDDGVEERERVKLLIMSGPGKYYWGGGGNCKALSFFLKILMWYSAFDVSE